MKLNLDCMREILILVEEHEYPTRLTIDILKEQLPSYSENDLNYTCLKLHEAAFIHVSTTKSISSAEYVVTIGDLTYQGHQFLETIRPTEVWEPTKKIAFKIGSFTVSGITQVATSVLTQIIKNELGLL